ncbi:MFS transporter [Acinetobacter calcoaceticus]|uniref:MFS transporter n=1 Tax=Acinetobacter calcoaceticus TaxID=471 RepID=UPI0005EE10BD|nr:MFS transporter [Acinetobacter calcoaceticus]
MEIDLREILNHKAMNTYQWFVVILCVFLIIVDGFDVMVMAFTAASVSKEWGLTGSQLGGLLSAGLVGMAMGSIFLAPWADKKGRRPLILCCLMISGVGMILSALVQSALQLGILRFITGLGIGGILASSNVLASEYASNRWRSLAVSLQSTGYAIGATIGGVIAVILINKFGWRSVFLTGGITTLVMLIVTYFSLPESLEYLLIKQPAKALEEINQLTQKLDLPQISILPSKATIAQSAKAGVAKLFSNGLAIPTICLWLSFFLVMFGFYFVMSWTPKILSSSGMTTEQGVTVGILLSAGGIIGSALVGLISAKIRIFYVQALFLGLTAISILLLVNSVSILTFALIFGLCLGVLVNGCVAGLYAMSPTIYDAEVRTTGVGFAIGFGRTGAILSPLVAGSFLDAGIPALSLYSYYACAFVLAIVVVLLIAKNRKQQEQEFTLKRSVI